MAKTLEDLKEMILDYTDEYNQISKDIYDIERQVKLYEQGNLEMRSGLWYIKARKALSIKKKQRLDASKKLSELRCDFKIAGLAAHNKRKEQECHLFYKKLEELMGTEALNQFVEDVYKTLDKECGLVEEPKDQIVPIYEEESSGDL